MSRNSGHSILLYYNDIRRTNPIYDSAEERELIRRWQENRDAAARDTLLRSHLRFVVTAARKRTKNLDLLQDLIAAGNLGLVKALDKYDLSRDPPPRFLTYAGWWIQKEMLDNDYATSSLVHVPTHRQKTQRKKAREFQRVVREHGPDSARAQALDPGLPEGATVSFEDLKDVLEHALRSSADIGVTDNDAAEMSGVMAETIDADRLLRRAIEQLTPREQTVLNLYYGVKDDPRNFVQIAALLEIHPERVRQIKIAGVERLKTILAQHHSVFAASHMY
jgi:RNA polymerase sigma factor (sigma-70 family)